MKKVEQQRESASARLSGELAWLGTHFDTLPGDVWVTEIRLKSPLDATAEWMAIVKAANEGGSVVAFVTAPDLDVLLHLVAAKLANGGLRWREDRPYGT